jgi:hypothetical protein
MMSSAAVGRGVDDLFQYSFSGDLHIQPVSLNIPGDTGQDKIFDRSSRAPAPGRGSTGRDAGMSKPNTRPPSGRGTSPKGGATCLATMSGQRSVAARVVGTDDCGEIDRRAGLRGLATRRRRRRIGSAEEDGASGGCRCVGRQRDRVAHASLGKLQRRYVETRPAFHGEVEHLEAMVRGCQRAVGLVGWVGTREKEHALESERTERAAGERQMAPMNGIERATEHADGDQGRRSSRPIWGTSRATSSAAARRRGSI